jgi:phosphate-selective porin OprO/OprP
MKIAHSSLAPLALVLLLPLPALGQPVPEPAPEAAPEPQPDPASETAPDTASESAPDPAAAPDTEAAPALAPEATAEPAPGIQVAYDKGLSITSADGQYALTLGVRGQLRAELLRPDGAGEFQAHFLIPRMRLQLEGHALGPANTYKVEFELSGSGSPNLKDYFVDHAFSPALRLRVGQWKRPFNRQELVSDFGSAFLERSITNGFAGGGRDLGIAVHNGYEKSPDGVEWALGVFNGTGDRGRQSLDCDDITDITTCTPTTPSNVPTDFGPVVVARVGWNQGGIKGYSEGDVEGGPLRLAVGASYKADLQDLAEDDAGDLQIQHAAEADFMVKIEGYDLSGAVLLVKRGSADPLLGFYVQPGAFVLPKQVQLAARFGWHQVNTDTDENRLEALGAINWYFAGHSYKWMTDAGIVQTMAGDGAEDLTDFQARTQLQIVF